LARSSFIESTTFRLFIECIVRGLGEVYIYEHMPLLLIRLSENHSLTSLLSISLWITGHFAYKQPLKEKLKFLCNGINK